MPDSEVIYHLIRLGLKNRTRDVERLGYQHYLQLIKAGNETEATRIASLLTDSGFTGLRPFRGDSK